MEVRLAPLRMLLNAYGVKENGIFLYTHSLLKYEVFSHETLLFFMGTATVSTVLYYLWTNTTSET